VEELKGELKKVVQGLAANFRSETEKDFKEAVEAIVEKYPADRMDMDGFATLIDYDIMTRLRSQLVKHYFPEAKGDRYICDLLMNYSLVEKIVKNLVASIHGDPSFSADCSRWILREYLKYLRSGKTVLPDMSSVNEDCYWKPDFGSAQQWMDLCETSLSLAHGKAVDFCTAYMRLVLEGRHI